MGNSSKKLLQQMNAYLQSQLTGALNAQRQESPYLTRIGQDATGFLDEVKKGDLRGIKNGTFFNLGSLSDRQKTSSLLSNAGSQGSSALGYTPKGLLDLDKENRNAELERDYAGDFQNAIQGGVANASNTLMGLGQADDQRRGGAVNALSGLYGQNMQYNTAQANKPPWWQSLISGGISAIPSIISAI